jgi:hypothetical protein
MRDKILPYLIIVALLVVIFTHRSCGDQKVVTRDIVKFDTIYKPVELPQKVVTRYVNKKGEIVYLPGKVDTVLVKEFENSDKKDSLYADAIRIRQYRQDFNDSIADVSIFAETQGELLKLAPTVKLKAKLPEKKTVFALYGGVDVFNSTSLDNFGVRAQLGVQNKRGDIISAGYDTNNNVYVGYTVRILNIRR